MRYLLAGLRLVLFSLITILCYAGYKVVLIFYPHNRRQGFMLRKVFLNLINPMLGFSIQRENMPVSDKPTLYVSHHRGMLDFFVVLRYVNAFVVSKAEVSKIPVFAPAASYTGVIFVKREDKKSRGATRRAIVDILQKGGNVLIFPEGTTNTGKTTMEFKKGAFEEMAKFGFPVVPVALEYKTKRDVWWEGGNWQMFVSQFGKWRTHCRLSFGQPINSKDPDTLLNTSREWIDDKLVEMQKGWSEVF